MTNNINGANQPTFLMTMVTMVFLPMAIILSAVGYLAHQVAGPDELTEKQIEQARNNIPEGMPANGGCLKGQIINPDRMHNVQASPFDEPKPRCIAQPIYANNLIKRSL